MPSLFDKAKQYFGMTARQQAVSKEIEYLLYEKVAEDIEQGFRDKGVWTKAFVEAEGDENKTKAKYIALMVLQLQLQIKAGLELQEIFDELGTQQFTYESETVKEKEPFEDYIQEEEPEIEETIQNENDPMFEEVELELRKQKDKAKRDVDANFAKARKDLNLKREKP